MKPISPEVSALRLSLPALLALALGVGCGTLALAQTVALPSFTPLIWGAWALALAFCLANRWLTQRACRAQIRSEKRGADWALWAIFQWLAWGAALLFCILPPLTVMGGFTFLVPPDVLTDDNMKVAVFVGWVCIGIVFLGGASTGKAQPMLSTQGRSALLGEAPVPLAVALFPTLSLFGLLNIVTVDTPVIVGFFAFLAASLYLIGYENYLDQVLNRRSATAPDSASTRANAARERASASTRSAAGRSPATQYIAICAVWFATFGLVAAAFFYPLAAVLPGASLALDFSRKPTQPGRTSTDDWREPGRGFSLRGGNYTLSSEEIARVETRGSAPSALWRARIYEVYSSGADALENGEEAASRWGVVDADDTSRLQNNTGDGVELLPLHDELLQELDVAEMADAKNIAYLDAWSRVQPLTPGVAGLPDALFSLGQPIEVRGSFENVAVRPDGSVRFNVQSRSRRYARPFGRRQRENGAGDGIGYDVRSRVPQPNLVQLRKAPGLNAAQLRRWRDNPITAPSLDVPQSDATRAGFAKIIAQIEAREREAGRRLETPSQRADAVARFLTDTCEYSLNVPTIPPTQDAALFFMTSSKRGACDMFASSMTLLLRSMNIPARLATGYVQPDIPDPMGNGNTYTLRGTDAHAWVEYFVPRIGWMTFDPTEGTRLADQSLSAQVSELFHLPSTWKNFVTPASMAALLLAAGGAALLLFTQRRNSSRQKPAATDAEAASRARAEAASRARIRAAYERAQQMMMSRAALPDGVSARALTPREWENTVLAQPLPHDAKSEFAALTYLFDLASYAPSLPVDSADATQLRASLSRLRTALKRKPNSKREREKI